MSENEISEKVFLTDLENDEEDDPENRFSLLNPKTESGECRLVLNR